MSARLILTSVYGHLFGSVSLPQPYTTCPLHHLTFLDSLNSRQLLTNGGMEIFGADSTTERNFIARAQRLAAAERYNVPQVSDPSAQNRECYADVLGKISCPNGHRRGSTSR